MGARLAWLLDAINIRNLCFVYFALAPFLLDRKSVPVLLVLFGVGYLVSGAILVLALAERLSNLSVNIRYSLYSIPVFMMVGMVFLTSLVSNPDGYLSAILWYTKFGKILVPSLVFFVMVSVFSAKDLPRLYGILVILGSVSFLLAPVDVVRGLLGWGMVQMRIGDSMFGDPNKYAVFLNILYAMVLAGLISRLLEGRRCFAHLMFVACILVSLFLTQSRSGILSFALISLLGVWLSRSRQVIRTAILLFVPVSLLLGAAILLRYMSAHSAVQSDLGRIWTYIVAWNAITDNFFFGVGFGNTAEMYDRYGKLYEALIGMPLDIHNTMLEVFAQQGVFGFLAYMTFVFVPLVVLCRRIFRRPPGAYPAIEFAALSVPLCFFVYGLFYHQYITNEHFWTLMAFTMVVLKSGESLAGEFAPRLPRWI